MQVFITHSAVATQSLETLQVVGQLPLTPSHAYPPQDGRPADPLGRTVHAPSDEAPNAFAQASQPPVHSASQHTPSAQKPESHSLAAAHTPPVAVFGTQAPSSHRCVATHSSSPRHVVRHAVPAESHVHGAQGTAIAARHTPAPSHSRRGVASPATHTDAPHTVPAAPRRQSGIAASPLHPSPVGPHGSDGEAPHSASGSWPPKTGAQTPSVAPVFANEHARHVPSQASTQHTPSAHAPLAQSESTAHATPRPHGPQAPPQSTPDSSPERMPSEQSAAPPPAPAEPPWPPALVELSFAGACPHATASPATSSQAVLATRVCTGNRLSSFLAATSRRRASRCR